MSNIASPRIHYDVVLDTIRTESEAEDIEERST